MQMRSLFCFQEVSPMSQFSYRLIRADRKTISIRITPEGEILVRAPRFMPDADIRRFVASKGPWIEKHLSDQKTVTPLTQEQIRELARQALDIIPQRVAHFAPMLGVTYGRITIRNQRSRWGSCSAQGNLNFNCLLMLCPAEVVDYVVIHELCHRKHMDHSPAFWAEVGQICPEWRRYRDWLRDNGGALIAGMTAGT
jgi:predicted metal-dependent hydrolase